MCILKKKCAQTTCVGCIDYWNFLPKFKWTIAVDFDGTLCTHAYPNIGEPSEIHLSIREYIRMMHKKGALIILWTCRKNKDLEKAAQYCQANLIPIDFYNYNPMDFRIWGDCNGKILADEYIDDKAVTIQEVYEAMRKKTNGG